MFCWTIPAQLQEASLDAKSSLLAFTSDSSATTAQRWAFNFGRSSINMCICLYLQSRLQLEKKGGVNFCFMGGNEKDQCHRQGFH